MHPPNRPAEIHALEDGHESTSSIFLAGTNGYGYGDVGGGWRATSPMLKSAPIRDKGFADLEGMELGMGVGRGISQDMSPPALEHIHAALDSMRNSLRQLSDMFVSFGAVVSGRGLSSRGPSMRPLTAPVANASTLRLVVLCTLWYASSALSSNTGKAILNQFRYPVTLTLVQFFFVASYCILFMSPAVRFSRFRRPSKGVLQSTLYMGLFQVGGHMASSMAISRIPVSTTHTIKALSPLFTVAAYAMLFGVRYSAQTYLSLLPLTLGVMLACTFDVSASNPVGLLCAFGSAIIFVSSNIFFKKIMPSGSTTSSHKLDKLNLLLYSSGMAFMLMIPIWLLSDLSMLMRAVEEPMHTTHPKTGHEAPHSLAYYFFMNGTVHFAQNIIAFIILSSVSPVTYSIASLIKRVAVICIAIVWFSQSVHPVQGLGISMTFMGLWMYNRAKGDVERGENKVRREEAKREMMIPLNRDEERMLTGSGPSTPVPSDMHMNGGATSAPSGTSRTRIHLGPPPRHAGSPGNGAYPQLHIEISSTAGDGNAILSKRNVVSPSGLYPSPPPSLDSPTSESQAVDYTQVGGGHQLGAEAALVGRVTA